MAAGTQEFSCLFVLNVVSRICLKAEAWTLWSEIGSNLQGQTQPFLRNQTFNILWISLRPSNRVGYKDFNEIHNSAVLSWWNGWLPKGFIVSERGFEISAIAELCSSQSKTKPHLADYVTQPLHAPKICPASLFKPATVRLRSQLPQPPRIRVFEQRKFSPCKHAHIVPQVVLCLFAQRRTNSSSPSRSKVSWKRRSRSLATLAGHVTRVL